MLEQTVKNLNWVIADPPDNDKVSEISRELGLTDAAAKLLCQRGCDSPKLAKNYISDASARFYDPFRLAGMREAVDRICEALKNREKILIYGDYDADGVTSTAILYDYLRINSADVKFHIPDRFAEGYGVSADVVKKYAEDGFGLVITVDCGVTAVEEVKMAKEIGLDFVVTDHHECRDLLPDCPTVDPRRPDCAYPFKDLAGVGVAFKLICALETVLRKTEPLKALGFAVKRYAEIITLGTIADVMPLTGENRTIVKYGLRCLEHPSNLGLRRLMFAASLTEPDGTLKRRTSSTTVAFALAPRINAAGRMESANLALELLLTEFPERADALAKRLCELNSRRQDLEFSIATDAERLISLQCRPDDRVIVVCGEGWHHGVIGIVASRITEKFNLPTIVLTDDGDVLKGSGRSVEGFELIGAIGKCGDLLTKYGGHAMAAGLSLKRENLENFRRRLNDLAKMTEIPAPKLPIDLELDPNELDLRLAKEISLLEPFGAGNPEPVLAARGLTIDEIYPLSGGKHTKLTLRAGARRFTGLLFGQKTDEFGFRTGDVIDAAFNLSQNDFGGKISLQLLLKDCK